MGYVTDRTSRREDMRTGFTMFDGMPSMPLMDSTGSHRSGSDGLKEIQGTQGTEEDPNALRSAHRPPNEDDTEPEGSSLTGAVESVPVKRASGVRQKAARDKSYRARWIEYVTHLPREVLDDGSKVTAMHLAGYGDPYGHEVRPSLRTLARSRGKPDRSIKRHVSRLRAVGVLRVAAKGNSGGKANVYELVLPDGQGSDTSVTRVVNEISPG